MLFKGNSSRLEQLIGKIQAHKEPAPQDEHQTRKETLGTGSSSWQSEDGGGNSGRGGETPSSCATPTSASFPSEPEADADIVGNGANSDGNPSNSAPYPCQFCERTFPRLSYLKKHEQSHGDQMPYRCSWCARLFKHKRSRDRHVKLHTGDKRYRCTNCEAAFSRSDHLKIHMKTHDTQKPYQCTACSRGYNTAAALTSHMQSHKKNQGTPNPKYNIQDSDYGRRSVSSHSTSSPPVTSSPSPNLNLNSIPKTTTTTTTGYSKTSPIGMTTSITPIMTSPLKLTCMYCTRDSFSCMQQLQMHVHTMHQAILGGENLVMVPRSSPLSNKNVYPREKLGSDEGSKKEEKCPDLKTNDNPNTTIHQDHFSCKQCTMRFSSSATLRDHLISIHRTIDNNFGSALMMCPLCGVPCSSAAAYAEHYVLQHCDNRINLPELRESCDTNKINGTHDRDFRIAKNAADQEPADLTNKHKRIPENTNYGTTGPLLCGQCGAALKDFESFRAHVARHLQADRPENTTRYPCNKCEASFQEREDMLAHLTKHYLGQVTKEYACGACKKFYPHPDQLQRHLLDHHAHHLYRCALCRDTFDSRVAIQVHFAVKHSQECNVYRCRACDSPNNENSPNNTSTGEGTSFFKSEAEIANHVRNVHAPSMVSNNSPIVRSAASTPGIPSNRCVFCGICCSSELDLQLHLSSHSNSLYRCPVCREGFAVEFLLDRHLAQAHFIDQQTPVGFRNGQRENGRLLRAGRYHEEAKAQKRGRSPASSNNNSLNQRDNNNKRSNFNQRCASGNNSRNSNNGQQCKLCERGEFTSEAELQAHKKLVHPPVKTQSKSSSGLSLSCTYCGEVCRSRNELDSHTRLQHPSNESGGRHKCNICDEMCPTGAMLAEHKLLKHCKIRLSDNCVVCRGVLISESHFMEHVQRHSLENVDAHQRLDNNLPHLPAACVVCRQTLISDLECRLHARHHLRSSTGSLSSESSPSPSQKIQSSSCCLCLRDFPVEDFVNLPSNQNTAIGQNLRVCKPCYARHSQGMPILNSPYEYVRTPKPEKSWTPNQTELQWNPPTDKWDIETNSKSQDRVFPEKRVNKCEDCGIKFEDPIEAEKHRLRVHLEKFNGRTGNTYSCIQCQISFPSEKEIQEHVKKEHLESGNNTPQVLRCHLCLFEAHSPLQLQAHLIEHTFAGCTALSCYICQTLFTAPIGLQNHMLQEHGLGARPYDCSQCVLKFFFRTELDHHVLTQHCHNETPMITTEAPKTSHESKELNQYDTANDDRQIAIKEEVIQDLKKEAIDDEQNELGKIEQDEGQCDKDNEHLQHLNEEDSVKLISS